MMNIKKVIVQYIHSIPKKKQKKSLFYFYIINFFIAACVQFSWGFYTPMFDSSKYGEALAIIMGFVIIFALEIGFIMLALRHMDILEDDNKIQ